MTLKGGVTLACAACKHQRRKCTPECPLAPYFPADQPKLFMNCHKLFGVSNIVKILNQVEPCQKGIAMDSLIAQANYREKYPVHGCCEAINRVRYQIWQMEEELLLLRQHLEMCQQQHHQQSILEDVTSPLELGMTPCANSLQQQSYSNSNCVAYNNSCIMDSKDINVTNPLWANDHNSNSMSGQKQLVTTQLLSIQEEVVENYDEMNPFFDTIDDRQSYICSKESYESRYYIDHFLNKYNVCMCALEWDLSAM